MAQVDPPQPGEGMVAIAVTWAGINFKDVMQRRGDSGYADSYPVAPGLEVSGTIIAAGPGVPADSVGRRVCAVTANGGLAEVAVADWSLTVDIPDGVSDRSAAAAPGALTSAALLVDAFGRVRAGDVLLVHSAAGAVGRAVAQVARHRGAARLIGMVGAPSRVSAAQTNGYDEVLVRGDTTPEALRAMLHRAPIDLIIDPLGTAMMDFDLQVSGPGSRIIISGNAPGGPMAATPDIRALMGMGVQIGGFSLSALMARSPDLVAKAMRQVLELLRDGILVPELTTVPELAAVPGIHDALAAGAGQGKYVVDIAAQLPRAEARRASAGKV
ncbi:zinc-binding alcohol dehydrogenase family protein [Intrasporangium sp. DVR]|uniref:quinone oxidoreductase family protein n=1 Tax=Intrasporangium sp. DVR TaxID=3127867 RepID=UPI00313A74ED